MTMNIRHVRSLLWLTAAVFIAVGIFITTQTVMKPVADSTQSQQITPDAESTTTLTYTAPVPPLSDYKVIWDTNWRRPLYDPPKVPVVTQHRQPPKAKLTVRLVGTIHENDRAFAMFAVKKGNTELKEVGETLTDVGGDVEVLEINDESVTIRYAGEQMTLEIERKKEK